MSELDDLEEVLQALGLGSKSRFSDCCVNGHPKTEDNVFLCRHSNGKRYRKCKECHRESQARFRANPINRAEHLKRDRIKKSERYANDESYREKVKARVREFNRKARGGCE